MTTFYTTIFVVGILYTFVSFIITSIGGLHGLGGHGGMDTHFGHHHAGVDGNSINHTSGGGHGHTADAGASNTLLSWLGIIINPMVIVSFLTVFGGLGLMGTNYLSLLAPIVFIGSMLAGGVVSYSLYKFIVLPLYRSENTSNGSKENLLYEVAEVISPIMENGFGEIKYIVNELRYTAPAKHHKGKAIKQGEKVVIYKIENNIFYVVEFPELESIDLEESLKRDYE